jgi:hypothetical protein
MPRTVLILAKNYWALNVDSAWLRSPGLGGLGVKKESYLGEVSTDCLHIVHLNVTCVCYWN